MNPKTLKNFRWILVIVAAGLLTLSAACGNYKAPITDQPTRKIDDRLIGDWLSQDGGERVKIRALNEFTYIIAYPGVLFRAFHSDVGDVPFVNAQDLETSERYYIYLSYTLSDDGRTLHVRVVSDKVVPEDVKDAASVQKLLRENLANPFLFGNEGEFTRIQ